MPFSYIIEILIIFTRGIRHWQNFNVSGESIKENLTPPKIIVSLDGIFQWFCDFKILGGILGGIFLFHTVRRNCARREFALNLIEKSN